MALYTIEPATEWLLTASIAQDQTSHLAICGTEDENQALVWQNKQPAEHPSIFWVCIIFKKPRASSEDRNILEMWPPLQGAPSSHRALRPLQYFAVYRADGVDGPQEME